MKIYRSDHPLFVASFTDDETYSIVPPGNQAVYVPDNLWGQYTMKLVELQQLEYLIGEYFGQPVAVEPEEYEPSTIENEQESEWK